MPPCRETIGRLGVAHKEREACILSAADITSRTQMRNSNYTVSPKEIVR